jgi:glutathione synthase/RimK-type ligase-like ATP-grasp enzyme
MYLAKRNNFYILSNIGTIPSARLLRNELEKILEKKIILTSNYQKVTGKLLVRYGNSNEIFGEDLSPNTPEFIRLCANKKKFSELLLENNFYTPEFFSTGDPKNYPVMVRETLCGSHGLGIKIAEDEEAFKFLFRNGFYFTPFVNLSYELRIHVVDNKLVKGFVKKWTGEEEEKYKIKVNHNCHFKLTDLTRYNQLNKVIESLCEILNGYFYAVDVGWDGNKKQYFILEANSAPGLNELTANLYASSISERIQNVCRTGENS